MTETSETLRTVWQANTPVEEDEWGCLCCEAHGTRYGTLVSHIPNCPVAALGQALEELTEAKRLLRSAGRVDGWNEEVERFLTRDAAQFHNKMMESQDDD